VTVFLQSFMSQRRNISHNHHQKMILDHRKQEEMREDQTKSIAKERQMQASLQSEERVERKRFLRKMQDEEYGRQIEESLLKVGFSKIRQLYAQKNATHRMMYAVCICLDPH